MGTPKGCENPFGAKACPPPYALRFMGLNSGEKLATAVSPASGRKGGREKPFVEGGEIVTPFDVAQDRLRIAARADPCIKWRIMRE